MNKLVLVFLVLGFHPLSNAAQSPAVLYPSNYPSHEVNSLPESGWVALHRKNGTWLLSPAQVSTSPSVDEAIAISSSVPETKLLLRARGLKPGPVQVVGGEVKVEANTNRPLDEITCTGRAGCRERLRLGNNEEYELETLAVPGERHRLVFRVGKSKDRSQILIKEVGNYPWHLMLAGDLDGDGKLDLILRSDSACHGDQPLFLSSQTNSNELVHLVNPGSACL